MFIFIYFSGWNVVGDNFIKDVIFFIMYEGFFL